MRLYELVPGDPQAIKKYKVVLLHYCMCKIFCPIINLSLTVALCKIPPTTK